jgi:hypothetical protein
MDIFSLKTNVESEEQKKVLVRLPKSIARIIETMAHQRVRSFNNQMIALIKMGLANETEEAKALSNADALIAQLSTDGK